MSNEHDDDQDNDTTYPWERDGWLDDELRQSGWNENNAVPPEVARQISEAIEQAFRRCGLSTLVDDIARVVSRVVTAQVNAGVMKAVSEHLTRHERAIAELRERIAALESARPPDGSPA